MNRSRTPQASPLGGWAVRAVASRSIRFWLFAVLAIALAARLAAILAIDDPQKVPRTLAESDAPTYYVLAENMLDGTGYRYAADQPPTAKRTPGYPLLLASVFKVFGRSFNAVRGVQCALDLATTYLVFALTVLVFGSVAGGLLAALGYALYPPAILSSTYVMTETTYTFLLVLAVVAATLAIRARSYILYAVSGIVLGLSTLTRPGAFLLPAALLVVGLLVSRGVSSGLGTSVGRVLGKGATEHIERGVWNGLVVLIIAFLVTLLPWAARNQHALGKFIPTSTLMGANLYKGNHLGTQGAYFWSTDSLLTPDLRAQLSGADEVGRDRILQIAARKMILANKGAIAILTLKKIPRLWLNLGYGRASSKKSLALASFHLGLIALGVCGLLGLTRETKVLSFFPLTTVVFSSIMYLAVASEVRFVFPLVPLVLPYSAVGLLRLLESLAGGKMTGARP